MNYCSSRKEKKRKKKKKKKERKKKKKRGIGIHEGIKKVSKKTI
jgi:hypothetical protein